MDNITTKIYKCVGNNEEEIHIYKDGIWLFGIRRDLVSRSAIVEIMKLFKLNYPYTFLNEL